MEESFVNDFRDQNSDWRYDMLPHFEQIGMSHYNILKSLITINCSKYLMTPGDDFQLFKNVYFHFGLILDLVENIARNIFLTENQIGLREEINELKIAREQIEEEFSKFLSKHYDKYFKNWLLRGRSLNYTFSPKHFLDLLLPKTLIFSRFKQFSDDIVTFTFIILQLN
jgi:hypothetical protein